MNTDSTVDLAILCICKKPSVLFALKELSAVKDLWCNKEEIFLIHMLRYTSNDLDRKFDW